MTNKTIVFVFGTRPELIKMIPLIIESKKRPGARTIVCSTGQHKDMLESLYQFFDIRPDVDFQLMKTNQSLVGLHAETMNKMLKVIEQYRPDWVVVQGDTTSAHAAAMTAFYQKIAVAHVEAGLRTYDIRSPFPEEMNRRVIGLVAKAHLCPTKEAAANLKKEQTDAASFIEITGNTGIDTLMLVAEKIKTQENLKKTFVERFSFLNNEKFILVTMHRRENFGSAQQEVLKAFLEITKLRNINILFPVHPNPNVRKAIDETFSAQIGKSVFWVDKNYTNQKENKSGNIFLLDPLEYSSLVYVMQKCHFLMTDSGGLQEEAPSFAKKILVLRSSTERPEGVTAGFSQLVGTDFKKIVAEALVLIDSQDHWDQEIPVNPYGNGSAAKIILDILTR